MPIWDKNKRPKTRKALIIIIIIIIIIMLQPKNSYCLCTWVEKSTCDSYVMHNPIPYTITSHAAQALHFPS